MQKGITLQNCHLNGLLRARFWQAPSTHCVTNSNIWQTCCSNTENTLYDFITWLCRASLKGRINPMSLQTDIKSIFTRVGVLPYKGLMGTCGQPGYVFRDFCLKQGIEFINFCLKQGIKNRNSVLNRVGKSAIFVLNRVRVWGAAPHLPTQGYIEYLPPWIFTALFSVQFIIFFSLGYVMLLCISFEFLFVK